MAFNQALFAKTLIKTIRFVGNDVTQESILRQEMFVKEGDAVDYVKIEESVQAIMDLGLFRKVHYYLGEDYVTGSTDPAAELVVVVKEKYYMLVIPRLRYEDNQLRMGVHLNWDNVNGLDHSMRLLFERKGKLEGVTEYHQQFRYSYPNVAGSKYSLSFSFNDQNSVEENVDGVLQNQLDQSFGIGLFKWLNREKRKRGMYASLGTGYILRSYEDIQTQVILDETDAVTLSGEYGYKNVHEYLYNRGGKHFGYRLTISDEMFGSTSEYFNHYLFYRSYYRFDSRPDDNLNVQTLLGHSTDDILDDRAYTLDYRNDLRGYERSSFQGNTMLLVNVEYLRPSEPHPLLRYVYFIDVGNTFDQFSDLGHGPLKVGVGFGLRWKIPAFVRIDLRLDVGYAVSDDEYKVTVGTRHAF